MTSLTFPNPVMDHKVIVIHSDMDDPGMEFWDQEWK